MNIRRTLLIATIGLSLLTSGCGTSQTTETEQLQRQVVQLTQENAKLKGQENGSSSISGSKVIKVGDTEESKDFCDFTIKKVEFTKKVYLNEVKNPNNTYLHIVVAVKNLQTTEVDYQKFMDVQAIYDNKYNYTGFSVLQTEGGDDFDIIGNIEPLTTRILDFIIEVPNQVAIDKNPLKLVITVNGNTYECNVR